MTKKSLINYSVVVLVVLVVFGAICAVGMAIEADDARTEKRNIREVNSWCERLNAVRVENPNGWQTCMQGSKVVWDESD